MSSVAKMIRQTLTVARRDFTATVFTPTFLIFLFAPLIMLSFSAIGGLGAASMAQSSEGKLQIVALVDSATGAKLLAADKQLRPLYSRGDGPPGLKIVAPASDVAAQARALFDKDKSGVTAVSYGTLQSPTIVYHDPSIRHARYLARLAEDVLRHDRIGDLPDLSNARITEIDRKGTSVIGQSGASFGAVFALFFLTLMLAGQAVGTMAEERTSKVIEVLAASVPLESVFLGKLIGMFGVALLFICFWGGLLGAVGTLVPPEVAKGIADLRPAVGFGTFAVLFVCYFALAYMLLGSVFLGVGAQASTPREIQMLSLPITIVQVGMFGLSAAAAAKPGSALATFAEVFPFSSPFAMAAHAANEPEIWPHLAAIAWQLLWVSISIGVGARLFRRGVLQSSGPKMRWFRRKTA